MSTTNLFVELIVVGSGAATWLVLLVSLVIQDPLSFWEKALGMTSLAIPALALTYVLGIVVDRLADQTIANRHSGYTGPGTFYADRGRVLKDSNAFTQQYEYSRIRQRVCRGWVINALGILVTGNVFALARPGVIPQEWTTDLVLSGVTLALGIGCFLSWKALVKAEHERLAEHVALLNTQPAQLSPRTLTPLE